MNTEIREVKGDPKDERIAKLERLARLQAEQMAGLMGTVTVPGTAYEIAVDKITHTIRFADETESSVRVIIEPNDRL